MKIIADKTGRIDAVATTEANKPADHFGHFSLPTRQARKLNQFDSVAALRRVAGTTNAIVFYGQKALRRGTEFDCRKWAVSNRVLLLNAND